jgi:hypothetical protein
MRQSELVADRFVKRAGVWIDLATAEVVRLGLPELPAAADAGPWLERSAALWSARHPDLVRLIDYGCVGASSVFEAWRVPATARRAAAAMR